MRRRDFTIGLLLAAASRTVRAQEPAKQHRIAIVIPAVPSPSISDTGIRAWQAFFEELRRLGDVEGQNLTVERYSGEGHPEGYADLAREVVSRNPDVIVASHRPDRAGGPRGHRHNTDRLDRAAIRSGRARDEPGAPGRQHYRRHCLRGDRDLGKAAADPQGSRPLGIQGRVPGHAHGWEG